MDWCAIVFSHEQVADLKYTEVEDEFQLLYLTAGSPKGMALFTLKTFPLHPIYYISPEGHKHAAGLLQKYDSINCKQPPLQDIELIAGDYSAPLDIQLATRLHDERARHGGFLGRLH